MQRHKVVQLLGTACQIKLTVITGFTKDIGAESDDLNLAVSLFFITFVLFQPPSAAAGRWMGAKNWIPIIMVIQKHPYILDQRSNIHQVCWGILTISQAFIKGRGE